MNGKELVGDEKGAYHEKNKYKVNFNTFKIDSLFIESFIALICTLFDDSVN